MSCIGWRSPEDDVSTTSQEVGILAHFLPELSNQEGDRVILTQHCLACLSHASYLIGDETSGRACVVDPRRDVAPRRPAEPDHDLDADSSA